MKSRFLLAVSIFTALVVLSQGAVQAQEQQQRPGARFKFAANTWKNEQPRLPSGYDAPSQVRQGAMPRSSNFLGVDPGYLSRPAAPPPQIAARPAMPQVSAKAFVPNTSFMPAFGQPVQALQAGSPIAMAPSTPQAPIPQLAAPTSARTAAPAHKPRKSAPQRSYAKSVSAKLRTPTRTAGQSATPATYGNNVGYVPGGYLPAQSGYGTNARADVHGRIIRH